MPWVPDRAPRKPELIAQARTLLAEEHECRRDRERGEQMEREHPGFEIHAGEASESGLAM
jgi:hypothetical protein